MSGAEGVPLTRELLEALVEAAGMQSDMALPNVNLANVWYAVKQKCAAALASDAGTPEGERCPYCSFAPESLNDYCNKHRPTFFSAAPASEPEAEPEVLDSIRRGIADIESGRFVVIPAPLAESAAAPPTNAPEISTSLVDAAAPDAELDGLIIAHASTVHQHPQDSFALGKTHQAIRAHVEKVTREAHDIGFRRGLRELPPDLRRPPEDDELPRAVDMMAAMEAPAPAPGDASGETLEDWCATVLPFLDQGIYDGVDFDHDEAHRLAVGHLDRLRRLCRAATGEVVGTATLYGGGKDGTSIGPGPDDELPELGDREIYRVSLVRLRDKEGV